MLSTYAFRNDRSREKLKKPTMVFLTYMVQTMKFGLFISLPSALYLTRVGPKLIYIVLYFIIYTYFKTNFKIIFLNLLCDD